MIFERREEVLVRVMVGRFEGVTVMTFWRARLVADVEVEDAVEDVRVLLGEERPRARRMRSLSAIAVCIWGIEDLERFCAAVEEEIVCFGGCVRARVCCNVGV